jgi:VacB/RNase II family 3'-5' exoribonuclease
MDHIDLKAAARQEMLDEGFHPDFSAEAQAQVASLAAGDGAHSLASFAADVRDLRDLLWSSIDNDTSRDLDQIEVAEPLSNGGIRILIGIADVDSAVPRGTPIDLHARSEATSVYTGVETFAMLPEELSTGMTSLLQDEDRLCMVVEIVMGPDAQIESGTAYLALVRNKAQLTYSGVGPWLEGASAAPPKVAASTALQEQLKLQDGASQRLRTARYQAGALNLDTIETAPVLSDGHITGIHAVKKNRASELIEDFMIAANVVVARLLSDAGVSSIRRVVKTPERWDRIVSLAASLGERLPEEADSAALNAFLLRRKAADPLHSPDLALAVIKLMGPGEYTLERPGDPNPGHFGLAVRDYTHSTAPNRRYADLVTQRLIKTTVARKATPYGDSELEAIARTCTLREDAARKVERSMRKRIAAVALAPRVGEVFRAVVTGVTPKGTFVRTLEPPADGRVIRGFQGLDVGDQVVVRLVGTNAQRGFIDFAVTGADR